jgi:hypothetical protein
LVEKLNDVFTRDPNETSLVPILAAVEATLAAVEATFAAVVATFANMAKNGRAGDTKPMHINKIINENIVEL